LLTGCHAGCPDIEVIPLSEHVDYWNYLGWQDPVLIASVFARQQDYGRIFGRRASTRRR